MSNVVDKFNDWFHARKGAVRKQTVDTLVTQRRSARRELDKAIEDLIHSRSKKWSSSRRSSNTGRSG